MSQNLTELKNKQTRIFVTRIPPAEGQTSFVLTSKAEEWVEDERKNTHLDKNLLAIFINVFMIFIRLTKFDSLHISVMTQNISLFTI